MGQHTANAGRIYFPSGTPDLDDIRDGAFDISGSVAREARGGDRASARPTTRPIRIGTASTPGLRVAMIRILRVDMTGEALRARIEANLALQRQPELSAIHLVRDAHDLTAAMPRFVTLHRSAFRPTLTCRRQLALRRAP